MTNSQLIKMVKDDQKSFCEWAKSRGWALYAGKNGKKAFRHTDWPCAVPALIVFRLYADDRRAADEIQKEIDALDI